MAAKTLFQTNTAYDPRLAIAVDGVVVHQHGAEVGPLRDAIRSWKQHGYTVGRMFFADSDGINEYWTGKWDGTPHPDEVEHDASGNRVECAGVRPYMLPTDGWIRYLEEMARESIDAGADAILPEEPLAHLHTGYEERFRELWLQRYGRPWEPESASPAARFLTGQLKNELYVELERRLLNATRQHAEEAERPVAFVVPVHPLYSNIAARLVAPLGTSRDIGTIDGYIGQVWTGPVNWALANYDSPDKSFFASAYALYDYFVQLVDGTDRKLWLLADPVEDDPAHSWAEFETWYRHCVAAKLFFPQVDSFEVMPWPDRIFLPGYSTGGGTPAPERFRIIILSAVQVLQEVPAGGQWCGAGAEHLAADLGIAVADTMLWEQPAPPLLQDAYALLQPLLQAGVPASACIAERFDDPGYLDRYRAIVLSYEAWKPLDAAANEAMATWVRKGGSLIILGAPDDLGGAPFWWQNLAHASPLHHLGSELGIEMAVDGEHVVGKGRVYRRVASPRRFADPAVAREVYLPLVDRALRDSGAAAGLKAPGNFCMRRGPFVIASVTRAPLDIAGAFVDVFDPALPVVDRLRLAPGQSGVYRDVGAIMAPQSSPEQPNPQVLHATHRLIADHFEDDVSRITVRGPAETPAVVRLFRAGREPEAVHVRGASGQQLPVEVQQDERTILARFPNQPEGATFEIHWASPSTTRPSPDHEP